MKWQLQETLISRNFSALNGIMQSDWNFIERALISQLCIISSSRIGGLSVQEVYEQNLQGASSLALICFIFLQKIFCQPSLQNFREHHTTCYQFIDAYERMIVERRRRVRFAETVGRRSAARTRSAGNLRIRKQEVTLLCNTRSIYPTPCPNSPLHHPTSTPDPLSVRHLFILTTF